MSSDKSFGELSYEQFAERYAAIVETKPHNAYLADPAITALLPPVAGLRILDAGCGSGWYSERFLDAGAAHVTAIDVTPAFIAIARKRLGERATILRHDLREPLAFAADASYDLVFSNLVFDYLPDLAPVLREIARVLVPGGTFVTCFGHPTGDWVLALSGRLTMDDAPDYFALQAFDFAWGGFGEPRPVVRSYRRPLSAILMPLIESGLVLDGMIEAQPTEAFRDADPADYERHMRSPTFLALRARRPGG
ncbi:MAG: class I SAM-dependent methyltransferase [Anaerolineae bacterium]|nr:class I SAM-dependent methyltransferase [Anaerolineae bacterium]